MVSGPGSNRQDAPPAAAWTTSWTTGATLVALAVALRLWHVGQGLPDFLEEAIPFKKALEMWGWQTGQSDLNPHFFNYPSLSLYLHHLLQQLHLAAGRLAGAYAGAADYWLAYQIDPTPHVILARLLGVACDAATVLAVWRIGERLRSGAGALAAALVAVAGTMIVNARLVQADLPLTALSLWSLERLLAWQEAGGRSRLWTACILLGLAAGAKYTAGLLVLPLAWALHARGGRRALALWPVAVGLAVLAFLATTPYALLDARQFWADFSFERQHMAQGHFGTLDRPGAPFYLATLGRDLGWPALAALVGAGIWLLRHRRDPRAGALATVWIAFLPGAVSIASFRMEAARYLLPLLPLAALLAAEGTLALAAAWRRRRPGPAAAVLAAVLLAPAVWHGLPIAATGASDTRQDARIWIETNLDPSALVVQETYGAEVLTPFDLLRVSRHPRFAAASEEMRRRWLDQRGLRVVTMPMAASGSYVMTAAPPGGEPVSLTVYEHAADLNAIFYEPSLFIDVDFVLTSGAVRHRHEQDPARYPVQRALYRLLDTEAEVAARFEPGRGKDGPTIVVYRLGDRCQRYLRERHGRLDSFWWADTVDARFRTRVEEILLPPAERSGGAKYAPDGRPAQWVLNLKRPFDTYVMPFLMPMAQHFLELGRFQQGRRYTSVVLAMKPQETSAAVIYSQCATQLGDWETARQVVVGTLAMPPSGEGDRTALRFEYYRLLRHAGERDAAIAELEAILAEAPPGHPAVPVARRLLALERDERDGTGSGGE